MLTLYNDFHNSRVSVHPRADGTISARTLAAVARNLCGVRGCRCGGIRGARNPGIVFSYDPAGHVMATVAAQTLLESC